MSFLVIFVLPVLIAFAYKYICVTAHEIKAIKSQDVAALDPMQRAVIPEIVALVILSSVTHIWISKFYPVRGLEVMLLSRIGIPRPLLVYFLLFKTSILTTELRADKYMLAVFASLSIIGTFSYCNGGLY